MKKLHILIADDHELVRQGIRHVLQSQSDWKIVGEAASSSEAIRKIVDLKPDVALVDMSMPNLDGIQVLRQIHKLAPSTKVLVISMHESGHVVRGALKAGALGYLMKSDLAGNLIKAVQAVARGERFLTPKTSGIAMEESVGEKNDDRTYSDNGRAQSLSDREIEIAALLARGESNKEIASHLGITVRTVETHRSKVMLKLGLRSLAELIHYAIRHGIVSNDDGRK